MIQRREAIPYPLAPNPERSRRPMGTSQRSTHPVELVGVAPDAARQNVRRERHRGDFARENESSAAWPARHRARLRNPSLGVVVGQRRHSTRRIWPAGIEYATPGGSWSSERRRRIDALRLGRRVAQNAPMKTVIYMVGALALIVIGSITWSTMLLGSH